MPKRTPEELVKSLDDSPAVDDIDAEIERVLAMTDEERRKELADAGVDLDALHAKADAWTAGPKPVAETPPASSPRVAPFPPISGERAGVRGLPSQRVGLTKPAPRARIFPLAAGALLAACAAAAAAVHFLSTPPAPEPSPLPAFPLPTGEKPAPGPSIAELRGHALDACKAQHWRECLDALDQARAADPDGDQAPLVTLARQQAVAGLEPRAPAPTNVDAKRVPPPLPTAPPKR